MNNEKFMIERRRFLRKDMELPLQLRKIYDSKPILIQNSFSKNISQIGLQIITFDFYAVNEQVYLQLFSTDCMCLFQALVRVVWVQQFPMQEKYSIGIEFLELAQYTYQSLNDLMEDG